MNRLALHRFAFKLALLGMIAAIQWSQFPKVLVSLCIFWSMFDVGAAIVRRESVAAPFLTYWDEAGAFVIIGLGASFLHAA